jgi:DNA-directed RNA polymerase subunit RPC12/RpoP
MLTQALANLEAAKRQGVPNLIGDAHLAVISALSETVDGTKNLEQKWILCHQMIDHADEALSAYATLASPWHAMQTHLVKAAVLADMAETSQRPGVRQAYVGHAFYHCRQAWGLLDASNEGRYRIVSAWHAPASAILLKLRSLVEDREGQQMIERLIEATSEFLGASLASDLQCQDEGADRLFTARLLGSLADIEMDPQTRVTLLESQLESALGAAAYLQHASAPELAQEAWELVAETDDRLSSLKAIIMNRTTQPAQCPQCGHDNRAGAVFCTRCGIRLPVEGVDAEASTEGHACPSCTHRNASSAKFCTRCGRRLIEEV